MTPIFKFLIVGAFAYSIQQWLGPQTSITVTPNKISLLKNQWEKSVGMQASPARLKSLVDVYIEEEILFRKAEEAGLLETPQVRQRMIKMAEFLELADTELNSGELFEMAIDTGLHRNDSVTRSMMISSARASISASVEPAGLTREDVRQYYLESSARYVDQGSLSFEHVFVSKNRNVDSRHRAQVLRSNGAFEDESGKHLAALGDPFIKGYSFSALPLSNLAGLMGTDFAKSIVQLSPGEWSEPLESTYGWHLVRVIDIKPARALSLAEAEHRVRRDLRETLEARAFELEFKKIKRGYSVDVEWPRSDSDSDTGDTAATTKSL